MLLAVLLLVGSQAEGYAKKQKPEDGQKKLSKIEKKEKTIEKHIGTMSNWKPEAFKDIRKGMTCSQVAQVFKRLNCGGTSSFKTAPGGLGTVSEYKFYFYHGRLTSATLIFGARLFDSRAFNTALLTVVQRKWGQIDNTADIYWQNGNFERIRLKYNNTHWELECQLPSVDPGDVDLTRFDEAGIRTNLEAFFGGYGGSVPEFFKTYRYHMSWQEVKGMHPDLNYDPSKSINYCYVSIANNPLIAGMKFRIDSGLLEGVEAIFHWQIPRELFKTISFEAMKVKYGSKVNDEQLVKDSLSIYTAAKVFVYREWQTHRWAVRMRLPKDGTETAAVSSGAAPLKTSSKGNITGDWKLVAARIGDKTAPMEDGKDRRIEFTSGQQMVMKENGKTVVKNYYKRAGSGLYFTASLNGKAVKKFATVISCSDKQLVLIIEGQAPQMIFEKI